MFHLNFSIWFQFSLFPLYASQNLRITPAFSCHWPPPSTSQPSSSSTIYLPVYPNLGIWMAIQTVLSLLPFFFCSRHICIILHKDFWTHR